MIDSIVGKSFDTNVFFSGGAGIFMSYHDIVKPTYLWAVLKMMTMGNSIGLPFDTLHYLSTLSLTEWYTNRRYINPLRSIDYLGQYQPEQLDELITEVLKADDSIYRLCPRMNVARLLAPYTSQHMTFPVYVYTEQFETGVASDVNSLFPGVPVTYVYGNLEDALSRCDQNFTYMVSDIEQFVILAKLLEGTYSHILLASDYRYNRKPDGKFKYNLKSIMESYPFIRVETFIACNIPDLVQAIGELLTNFARGKEQSNAASDGTKNN